MKASEWIHRRGLRKYREMEGIEADPVVLRATLMALIDLLDELMGVPLHAIPPEWGVDGARGSDDTTVGEAPGANGPAEPSVPKMLSLNYYRRLARDIWGPPELNIQDIVIRLGVDYGKLARFARGATKDPTEHEEPERTFGNIIFSMIRWADDLGLDLGRCMELAIKTQQKFVRENPQR